jgi:prevent-host-death family protein
MVEKKEMVKMHQVYSLTEAKSKFSEIINRVLFRKEKFTITKKGKAVAVVAPFDEKPGGEGLILAKGALGQMDGVIDEMLEDIYHARSEETDRKVNL